MPKLRKLLKTRFSREFWKVFLTSLGMISSVVTLVSFMYDVKNPSLCIVLIYSTVILLVCLFSAFILTFKKHRLSLSFSNNLKVSVTSGDILSKGVNKNYVVIPVNEFFDTVVDSNIINESSLHGQFITKFYQYNHGELHEEIESYLNTSNVRGKEVERPKSQGYKIKYPLGTCVPIEKGQVTYVLLAMTHFDDDDHAYVELSEFGRCINQLCKFLSSNAGNEPAYIPLMGMGLSRLNQPAQFILKYTLDNIVGLKGIAIPGGLNIVVDPQIMDTLNLNEIIY